MINLQHRRCGILIIVFASGSSRVPTRLKKPWSAIQLSPLNCPKKLFQRRNRMWPQILLCVLVVSSFFACISCASVLSKRRIRISSTMPRNTHIHSLSNRVYWSTNSGIVKLRWSNYSWVLDDHFAVLNMAFDKWLTEIILILIWI